MLLLILLFSHIFFLDSFNVCARCSINACFPHNHLCVFISIFSSLCCFQFIFYFKWLYFISSFLNSPSQCFIVSLCCLLLSYFIMVFISLKFGYYLIVAFLKKDSYRTAHNLVSLLSLFQQ